MKKEDLSHELTLKYTFENFNFKDSSPTDLLLMYQDTYSDIISVLDRQEEDLVKKSREQIINSRVYTF